MDYDETKRVSAVQLDGAFNLSSTDRKSIPPHLSVWAEDLTTPEQAYAFLASNRPDSPNKLVIRLHVAKVRGLRSNVVEDKCYHNLLDIIWIHLFEDEDTTIRDKSPGADGHSGITGLDKKAGPSDLSKKQRRILRKELRAQLADLASDNNFLLEN